MSLLFGFHEDSHTHPSPKKYYKYTLDYPAITSLGTSVYPERGTSGGYRYISTEGFDEETTLTLFLHMFSTSTGKDITASTVIKYSLEFVDNSGGFSYHRIKVYDIMDFKVQKSGSRYSHFAINKKFVISKITGISDFSDYKLFSVYIDQFTDNLTGDTSTLEIIIENVK